MPLDRLDGPLKVRGPATYAYEWPVDTPPTCTRSRRPSPPAGSPGSTRAPRWHCPACSLVLTHENAPRLADFGDREVAVLQSDQIAFRGQIVGAVIAETSEVARHAAGLVRGDVRRAPARCRAARRTATTCTPRTQRQRRRSRPTPPTGDVDAALASAAVTVDATYTTSMEHHNPLEPHAMIALWSGDELTLYCSTQGVHPIARDRARRSDSTSERVRVISPTSAAGSARRCYHADTVLAAMAARLRRRPAGQARADPAADVLPGRLPPARPIQRIRLGADADGRLTAIAHDVVQQTARVKEYAEQTACATRVDVRRAEPPHDPPARRARPAGPDVDARTGRGPACSRSIRRWTSWPTCGLDPVELRIRNEPETDPESGLPFSSRNLVACLREGARRFGWERRDPTPRARARAAG